MVVRQLHEVELIISRLTTAIILAVTLCVVAVLFGVTFKTKEVTCQERASRVVFTLPLRAAAVGNLASGVAAQRALSNLFTSEIAKRLDVSFHMHPRPTVELLDVTQFDFEGKLAAHGLELSEVRHDIAPTPAQIRPRPWDAVDASGDGRINKTNGVVYAYVMTAMKPLDLCAPNQADITPSYNVDLDEFHQPIITMVVPRVGAPRSATISAAIPETDLAKFVVQETVLFTRTPRQLTTPAEVVASYPALRALKGGVHTPVTTATPRQVSVVRDGLSIILPNGAKAPVSIELSCLKDNAWLSITTRVTESHTVRAMYEMVAKVAAAAEWTRETCSGEECLSPLPFMPKEHV